ncbi:hypothetical protein VTK73DRAFT_7522 [Phialemonium thermophilum]|uniref:Uncharacterized protein n=1 Tax=Phialemonium thermophilum TaxID=223376 RepID=A0ABR3WDY4_9PEZI
MHSKYLFGVIFGWATSLTLAAPAPGELVFTPSEKGLKHRSKMQKRNPLIIQETIIEQPITIVQNQNLGVISQLAKIAEAEFASLVQSQFALVSQFEEIKNNIRINHFRARYSQVNTVIVTVTNVIDARDPSKVNKRYLVNQLLADNGFPDKQLVVMVTQAEEMTIAATPTLDLGRVLGTAASASAVSSATSAPIVSSFDPFAPFGQLNGSLILPYNTSAPKNALVLDDPANIVFPNARGGLFVESVDGFRSDCSTFGSRTSVFINLANVQLFSSFQEAAAAQLAGLELGTALPVIPAAVLAANPSLASAAALALQQGQNTTASTSSAAASRSSTASSSSSTATTTTKETAATTAKESASTAKASA